MKSNLRILYGDDKEENRNALSRALKLRKLEVDLASTPEEFLKMARSGNYGVLITDLEYSNDGREGYEVLRQIRELSALKVLYSGVSGFEYAAEAYESGADLTVLGKNESSLMSLLDEKLNSGGENAR